MSQQQSPQWRGDPSKMQHCFWSEFKNGLGDIGLVTKFKGNGDGFKPEQFGPFEFENFVYSVAQKTSQKGSTYYDIERRPKTAASAPAKEDYNEGARKGHEENMEAHRKMLDAISKLTTAVENLNVTLKTQTTIADEARMHLENIDRQLVKILPFPTAAKIAEEQTQ